MSGPAVALYYDPDGYVERAGPTVRGVMGRQVAGQQFLDAYLAHGRWDTLTAVVHSRRRADPLLATCQAHPSSRDKRRRLRVVAEAEFLSSSTPPADLVHFPNPPDARFAWARRAVNPTAFALCGVTHTLATPAAAEALCELVAAPFEPFDALVCTSRAVVATVWAVTDSYRDYLADRFGGTPVLRPRLELIPLGVNPDRFRPPTPAERIAARAKVGATADEVVVLCVGRLSHHAKAHPFPLFHAAGEAARRTGAKVHLVLAGWASNPAVAAAFAAGGRAFAAGARVSFLDGQDPGVRAAVWHAADLFASLPDSVQETFGLVVVEAMAAGLPVLASDWDGYRDLVSDGETGLLVPTRMIRGATATTANRLLTGATNYDHFLAEVGQTVAVDPAAAADAMIRLVSNADLRRRMGAAGRERVLRLFTWERVVRAYETLWAEQAAELNRVRATKSVVGESVRYPLPERAFAAYPTNWLDDADRLRPAADASARMMPLLAMPLTNTAADRRCCDAAVLGALLTGEARSVSDLVGELEQAGVPGVMARASVAWLLKYGLLVPA